MKRTVGRRTVAWHASMVIIRGNQTKRKLRITKCINEYRWKKNKYWILKLLRRKMKQETWLTVFFPRSSHIESTVLRQLYTTLNPWKICGKWKPENPRSVVLTINECRKKKQEKVSRAFESFQIGSTVLRHFRIALNPRKLFEKWKREKT